MKKVERNSSIELFRILATFLVLVVHWNGWFVGGLPDTIHANELFSNLGGQLLIRGLSVCCVNCFILLSGFFGMKLKWRSIINLYVALISILVPFYLFECFRSHSFSFLEFFKWMEGFSRSGYFIQNYVLLMFFSPVLNAFVNAYGKKILWWVLTFCGIEFWFECIQHVDTIGFRQGYSFLHFILMYMIGRCVALYLPKMQNIKRSYWVYGYFFCVLALSVLYVLNIGHSWGYCNPLVIASSICLFVPFTYGNFHNQKINAIAKSTLAVYIMQCFNPGYNTLVAIDNKLLVSLPYEQYLLMSLLVLVGFFSVCIIYDKVRLMVTTPVLSKIYFKFNI